MDGGDLRHLLPLAFVVKLPDLEGVGRVELVSKSKALSR